MSLTILRHPDPVLRKIAAPIPEVTDEIRELAAAMAETMYRAEGIGLAAPHTVELLYGLRQDGFDVPLDALGIRECADAIVGSLKK